MSKVQMATGFFTMDTVIAVCAEKDITAARAIAMKDVDAMRQSARAGNIEKATKMIANAKTVNKLGMDITNFMFAHPSENLKTIR
jgi:hypothetical protein